MSIRKAVHDLSSAMNGLTIYKGGKPQMTLAQRVAKRIEVATWEAPEALRTRAAQIVLGQIRDTYPVLNLDKILVSGERSLQDVLIRTVKAHGGLGDLDEALASALYDLKEPARTDFVSLLKDPAAAGVSEDIHHDISTLRAIAEAGLAGEMKGREDFLFAAQVFAHERSEAFGSVEGYRTAARHKDDFLAGLSVRRNLWDDAETVFAFEREGFNGKADDELIRLCDAVPGGDLPHPDSVRHEIAEIILMGRDTDLLARAAAAARVKPKIWEAESPAWQTERLRALDEAGDRIAPDAIGWAGLEEFHERCYAHHVRRAIAFELSLRDVKRSVTPEADDADFAM